MYFFYICSLTNDCKKMKKKIMNVCGMAILAIGIWACSGQKKGTANVEVATDSVEVAADVISVQADSTGYIVRVGEQSGKELLFRYHAFLVVVPLYFRKLRYRCPKQLPIR